MNEKELMIIEELVNEEILEYWQSDYSIKSEYITDLRNILTKYNLNETYRYKYEKELNED